MIRAERALLCGDARLLRFWRAFKRYSVVSHNLAVIWTVNPVEADSFSAVAVPDFDDVAVER